MFIIAIAYVLVGANFVDNQGKHADSYFRALTGLPILGAMAESASTGSKALLLLPVLS
jgi:hypothetical protein